MSADQHFNKPVWFILMAVTMCSIQLLIYAFLIVEAECEQTLVAVTHCVLF